MKNQKVLLTITGNIATATNTGQLTYDASRRKGEVFIATHVSTTYVWTVSGGVMLNKKKNTINESKIKWRMDRTVVRKNTWVTVLVKVTVKKIKWRNDGTFSARSARWCFQGSLKLIYCSDYWLSVPRERQTFKSQLHPLALFNFPAHF